jgi:hypothetical protein
MPALKLRRSPTFESIRRVNVGKYRVQPLFLFLSMIAAEAAAETQSARMFVPLTRNCLNGQNG